MLFPRAILLLVATAALAGCSEGDSRMQKGFEDGFKAQFVEKFDSSCRAAAEGAGAPTDMVAQVCKCAADELVKKYSASELMSLSPETATPVMKSCAAKSGLTL